MSGRRTLTDLSGQPKHTKSDKADLNEKRTQIERPDKADQNKDRRDDLAHGIGCAIAACFSRLHQRKAADVYDRAQNASHLQQVRVGAHRA